MEGDITRSFSTFLTMRFEILWVRSFETNFILGLTKYGNGDDCIVCITTRETVHASLSKRLSQLCGLHASSLLLLFLFTHTVVLHSWLTLLINSIRSVFIPFSFRHANLFTLSLSFSYFIFLCVDHISCWLKYTT